MGTAAVALPEGFELDAPAAAPGALPPGFELDQAPSTPPGQIPGQAPGNTGPGKSPFHTGAQNAGVIDKLIGAGEAAIHAVTGAVGGSIGGAVGGLGAAIDSIMNPSAAGPHAVEEGVGRGASQFTYAPRTPAGQDYGENVDTWAQQNLPAVVGVPHAPTGAVKTGVGGVFDALPQSTPEMARAEKLNAPAKEGIQQARDAGYVLTPTDAQSGGTARAVESLAGAGKLEKSASRKNAATTNDLVRQDVGLPDDVPLSREALAMVRGQAGQAYEAIKNAGDIQNDPAYFTELKRITSSYDTAAKSFPDLAKNPIQSTIDAINVPNMDAGSAIEAVKLLRNESDKAFHSGDKGLGKAYRDAAGALDNSIDRNLQTRAATSGDPALASAVSDYQAARRTIAKTYLADSALNDTTGNIDASVYARALKNNAPLSGPGLQVAQFAQQFPKLSKRVEGLSNSGGPSAVDSIIGSIVHPKGGLGSALAVLTGRPLARSLLLSKPVQDRIAGKARPPAEPAAPPEPPPEPTTSLGVNQPAAAAPPPGPLGDLTPDWQLAEPTTGRPPEVVPTDDLHPGPGEGVLPQQIRKTGDAVAPSRAAGAEIPAVPGRPDLPDAIPVGRPAEAAGTEPAVQAMGEPGAVLARQQQGAAAADRAAAVERAEPVPKGEATEIPETAAAPEPVEPIPAGEATEITPKAAKPAPAPDLGAGDPRLAEIDKLRSAAKSPEVVKALDAREKAVRKELADQAAETQKQADADELEKTATATTDPDLQKTLRDRAQALRGDKIPAGQTKEGQPAIKADTPDKIPAGQTKELKPPTAEALQAWREAHGLSNADAGRAVNVAHAFDLDPVAVDAAVKQYERQPRAFDRAIQRIIDKGAADATQAKQTASGGDQNAAPAQSTDQSATAAAVPDNNGADSAPAPGPDGSDAAAGRQAAKVKAPKKPGPRLLLD